MSNVLLTPNIIMKESLVILENMLVAARKVNRAYENQNKPNATFKRGDTVNVRRPNRFTVSSGAALAVQDITEVSVPVVVNKQRHVDFTFPTKDLTLIIEEFSDRYLKPAMAALANQIDFDVLAEANNIYNIVGTAGVTPANFAALASVTRRLNEEAAPVDETRTLIIDPAAEVTLADALKANFNPTGNISGIFEDAQIAKVAGLSVFMDQNVNLHTNGQRGGVPLVNGAPANGSTSLVTDAWTAAAANRLKTGDVFTIANVFAVNPQSRQTTGVLRQFVATADAASDGAGNVTISVSPAMFFSGALQNIDSQPADNAPLTFFGTASQVYTNNLGFHKDAITLVTVPLEMPAGVHFAARETYKGINLRIVRQYTIADDQIPTRIDVLYGTKTIYPELACRLAG